MMAAIGSAPEKNVSQVMGYFHGLVRIGSVSGLLFGGMLFDIAVLPLLIGLIGLQIGYKDRSGAVGRLGLLGPYVGIIVTFTAIAVSFFNPATDNWWWGFFAGLMLLMLGTTLFGIDALRRQITVLFQIPFPYHATARENIALGDLPAEPALAEVEAAARGAGAHEIIARLPHGQAQRSAAGGRHGVNNLYPLPHQDR